MRRLLAALLTVMVWPMAVQAQDKSGEVAVAQFTSGVAERRPIDQLYTLGSDASRVFFFTDLRQLGGQTVTHRWHYNGEVMAEVSFQVGGDRWRVWSSKNLMPEWSGDWTVAVIDGGGKVLHEDTLIYGQ